MSEKVTFNMATMPARIEALKETLPIILPQCDEIHIYLNHFEAVPDFLKHPKITTYLSSEHLGDMGDVGKFYNSDNWKEGYVFTVDDKILYPKDYVQKMIACIEKYKRKAVVSAHGRIFNDRKCTSYYFDYKEFLGCTMANSTDRFVPEIGTGAMAFHVDTIPEVSLEIFPLTNMTDIYFSMWMQKLKVPMVNPVRPKSWIKISQRHDDRYSIHNIWNKNDKVHTDLINSITWKIREVEI